MSNDIGSLLAATREAASGVIAANAPRIDRRAVPGGAISARSARPGRSGSSSRRARRRRRRPLGARRGVRGGRRACASTGMVFLMHSVTAATIARGGGARAGEAAAGAWPPARRSARSRSASAARARTSTAPELRAVARERRRDDLRPQELRHLGRPRRRLPGARSGRGGGRRADAYLVDGDDAGRQRSTASWDGLGMAGNSSVALELDGVELDDDDRIGEAGRGDRARLQRRRAVLPRRARGGQRRHRRGGRGGGDRARRATGATPTARRSPRSSTCST